MNPYIQNKMDELNNLCLKRHVRRLALFGSAVADDFKPGESDIDMLVEFFPMTPVQRADNYLSLMVELQNLFGTDVDLLEPGPIRNPYFKKTLEDTKVIIYEAA